MTSNNLVRGLVIGGLVGAGVGILFAPKSGKETREQIRNSTEEVLEKAKAQYGVVSKKLEELTAHSRGTLAEKKDRLKRAVAAGTEAYKQVKPDGHCLTGLYGDDALL